jgi:hypothetical protein
VVWINTRHQSAEPQNHICMTSSGQNQGSNTDHCHRRHGLQSDGTIKRLICQTKSKSWSYHAYNPLNGCGKHSVGKWELVLSDHIDIIAPEQIMCELL